VPIRSNITMTMKTISITARLILVLILPIDTAHSEEPSNAHYPKLIESLKSEDSYRTFCHAISEIEHHPKLSDEERIGLKIRLLSVAHHFLRSHEAPTEIPAMNLIPPDHGTSGKDPSDVKDPVLRAQYIKEIERNNALSEAQSKHGSLIAFRNGVIRTCQSMIQDSQNNNSKHLKVISDALRKYCKSPEEVKELQEMINQEAEEPRFCKNEESRKILADHMKPTGK
jgi:hypothetical protein